MDRLGREQLLRGGPRFEGRGRRLHRRFFSHGRLLYGRRGIRILDRFRHRLFRRSGRCCSGHHGFDHRFH